MPGSTKLAVPIWTARQPAIRNSSASSAAGDAADADHRDPDRARGLPRHPHGDGPDGRAGEPAGAEAEPRPARLHVDREAEQRVDAGQRVGPRLLGGAGEDRDVGHVGRELGDDGQARRLAHRGHHLVGHARVAAEGHAALLHVGAGDVDLEPGDAGGPVADAGHLRVLLDGVAADVHQERGVVLREARQHVPHEGADAHALQPDRVQEARRGSPRCAGVRSPSRGSR